MSCHVYVTTHTQARLVPVSDCQTLNIGFAGCLEACSSHYACLILVSDKGSSVNADDAYHEVYVMNY